MLQVNWKSLTALLVVSLTLTSCGSYIHDIQIDLRNNRLLLNGDTTSKPTETAYSAKVDADAIVKLSEVNGNFFNTTVTFNEKTVGLFGNDSAFKAALGTVTKAPALPNANTKLDTSKGKKSSALASENGQSTNFTTSDCETYAKQLLDTTSRLQYVLDYGRHLSSKLSVDNFDIEEVRKIVFNQVQSFAGNSSNYDPNHWSLPPLDSLTIRLYYELEKCYADLEKCVDNSLVKTKSNSDSLWLLRITQGHDALEKVGLDSMLRVTHATEVILERIGNYPKSVLLDTRQASGDEMQYPLLITTAEGRKDSINLNLYVVMRPKVDFSEGVFVSTLGDYKYYTSKDSVIHSDNANNSSVRGIIPAALMHFYYRGGWSTQPLELAASVGLGIDLANQSARYIAGLSLIVPAFERRIIITIGAVVGQVQMLSPSYTEGVSKYGTTNIPTIPYWKAAWTFGVSYDL